MYTFFFSSGFPQKGKMDEINHHFSSLRGCKAPHCCGESVYQLNMDEGVSLSKLSSLSSLNEDQEPQGVQHPACTEDQQLLHSLCGPSPYCQGPSYYTKESSEVNVSPEPPLWTWPVKSHMQPELLSFPGTEYSMIVNPTSTSSRAPPSTQEFYTCVHGVTNQMVQLVPCMSESLKCPYFELKDKPEEDTKKFNQLAAYLEKRVEVQANEIRFCTGKEEQTEYVLPLLPQPTDRS